MGVLRIDVDAHANRSLAALARSLLFVIPAKAGTRRLWFFKVSKSLGPRFRGADGTFYCRPSAASTIPCASARIACRWSRLRSEEHTSELQSLMRISYAVFCF